MGCPVRLCGAGGLSRRQDPPLPRYCRRNHDLPTPEEAAMIRRTRRRRNAVAVALYVNAAVLLAVLVALLSRGGGPSISVLPRAFGAEGAQPIAGGGSLYLMPGQMSLN